MQNNPTIVVVAFSVKYTCPKINIFNFPDKYWEVEEI